MKHIRKFPKESEVNDLMKEIINCLQTYIDSDDLDGLQERAEKALYAYRTANFKDPVALAADFGALKTRQYGAHVTAGLTNDGRIEYHGSNLPAAPELQQLYPNGWELCDHIELRDALRLVECDRCKVTRDFDPSLLADDGVKLHPSAQWQVIYRTKEGLDYCRESYSLINYPTPEALEWIVTRGVQQHQLGSAVIQLW